MNGQNGKVDFALERLNRTGPNAMSYRHDVPRVKRHMEQALKVCLAHWEPAGLQHISLMR